MIEPGIGGDGCFSFDCRLCVRRIAGTKLFVSESRISSFERISFGCARKKSLGAQISAVYLALLLLTSPAGAQPYPWEKDPKIAEAVGEWLKEVEGIVRIRATPILRTIVCRLPFTDITIEGLAKATGLDPIKIAHGVSALVDKGLVRIEPVAGGTVKIVPNGERARDTMRKWANDWCTSDDSCGVQR
jgi:hypothetical protein